MLKLEKSEVEEYLKMYLINNTIFILIKILISVIVIQFSYNNCR